MSFPKDLISLGYKAFGIESRFPSKSFGKPPSNPTENIVLVSTDNAMLVSSDGFILVAGS